MMRIAKMFANTVLLTLLNLGTNATVDIDIGTFNTVSECDKRDQMAKGIARSNSAGMHTLAGFPPALENWNNRNSFPVREF